MGLQDRLQNFISGPPQKGSARYFKSGDNAKYDPRSRLKPSDFDQNNHTRASDLMIENFLKVNWSSVSDKGISNVWNSPERKWIRYEDPTILSFRVFFDFISESSPLLLGFIDPGNNLDQDEYSIEDIKKKTYPNSALRYLLSIGEIERARYLLAFQNLLKKMSQLSPWFFQSLEGLDEAWKHGFEDDEFKSRIGKDKKITINTLDEAIDLRVTALIDFYRKACFDWVNRREMVPRNLRMFSAKIYVHEARYINLYGDPGNPVKQTTRADGENQFLYPTTDENYNQHVKAFGENPDEHDPRLTTGQVQRENTEISRVLFYFYYCEWLPDESVGVFTGLSNKELGLKSQKLVFNYGNVHEVNNYRLFHDRFATDAFVGALSKSINDFISSNDGKVFSEDAWPKQPALAQTGGIMDWLKDKAINFVKEKAEQLSVFLFGGRPDKIGRAYPPTLIQIMMDQMGLEETPANQLIAKRGLAEMSNIPAVAKVIDGVQAMFMGNVYGFSAAKLLAQIKGGVGGILDAANIEGLESNASLKNDDGSDASGFKTDAFGKNIGSMTARKITMLENKSIFDDKGPSLANGTGIDKDFIDMTYGADNDPSKSNDKGFDATLIETGDSQASLKNDKGPDAGKINPISIKNEFLYGGGASLLNDKGMDGSDEIPVDSQASLKNDKGMDAKDEPPVSDPMISIKNDNGPDAGKSNSFKNEFLYGGGASLTNDNGPDAKGETPADSQSSLKNDKGMDATNEAPVNSQASLTNDNGPDAKGETPADSQSSLKNDKGMDASNETPVDSQSSLKNDKGMDATNEAPVNPQSSLSNDKGMDAKGESPVDSQSSLKNDKGMDASSESPVNPQASLSNDKGMDAKGESPVNPQASLSNDKGPDAKSESPVDSQSSLKNDKGMDASNESPVDSQSSLKNDKGMDASSESPVDPQTSLKNDKGMDAKSEAPVDAQTSLKNDKGMDAKSEAPVDSQTSLKNDKGMDAKSEAPANSQTSLKNDKGMDAKSESPVDAQASLKNDKGPDAKSEAPVDSQTSLKNDKGMDASSESPVNAQASLKNDKGMDAKSEAPVDPQTSLKNDKGMDASSESPVDPQTSLKNDKGMDASSESPVDSKSSLKNDKGMDASSETPVDSQASLKNDKGMDASDTSIVNSQASLKNDKGPDSTDTAPGIDKNSLNNYKGPDSTDTAPVDPRTSLKNDTGMDSSNTDPSRDNVSLGNNKSPGASDVVGGNPLASLLNDKGPDSSDTPIGAPNVSLRNDNGPDSKGTQPGDDDISMTNG